MFDDQALEAVRQFSVLGAGATPERVASLFEAIDAASTEIESSQVCV